MYVSFLYAVIAPKVLNVGSTDTMVTLVCDEVDAVSSVMVVAVKAKILYGVAADGIPAETVT